jgi:UDP-glucose 4-epimerase
VTGGLGFIGSNLTLALARAGADVTVVDALYARHGGDRHNLDALDGADVHVIVSDLASPDARAAAAEADVVFNLAGQVSHVD